MEIIVKNADYSGNNIGVVTKRINTAVFNGTSAFASITPITLSADGDYMEMLLNVENTNIGYYFAFRELWGKPIISITKTKFSLRLNNQTWAVSNQTISPSDVSNITLKIAYEGTNIKVYIDGTLAFTYDNSITQAGLTFAGFGKYDQGLGSADYWKGSIKKARTNKALDGEWSGIDDFPGWSATDVVLI